MFCHSHKAPVFLPELRSFLWVSCCCPLKGQPHCSVLFVQPWSNKATPSRQGKGHESLSSLCWSKWSLWRLCNECWWTLIYTTLMMRTAMHTSHRLSQHCSRVNGVDMAGKKCSMCWRVSAEGHPCTPTWSLPSVVRGENGRTNPIFDAFSQKCTPGTLKNGFWQTSCLWGLPELKHLSWRLHKALLLYWLHQRTISGDPFNEQTTLPTTYKLIKKIFSQL